MSKKECIGGSIPLDTEAGRKNVDGSGKRKERSG